MFKCPKCEYENSKVNSLRIHVSKKHKMSSEELWIALHGPRPTCHCGCGEETKYNGLVEGYSKYKWGHASRVKNNWGHNMEARQKSIETRREMWKNGEIKAWCTGLTKDDPRIAAIIKKMNTPERAKKISESLTGKSKSKEHREKISKHMSAYWGKEKNRERQSRQQAERIKNGLHTKATRVHGYYENPKKSQEPSVYYRSLFELNALNYLEDCDDVRSYVFEPYRIEYTFGGKKRHYVVDCLIEYHDDRKVLIEIKPNCYVGYPKNQAKFDAAKAFAAEHGYIFEIWTEKTHQFLSTPES